ncbi:MAG: hypothetical protein AMXMBFR82_26910 [Candidatus Hydrogenedentota bacterium]
MQVCSCPHCGTPRIITSKVPKDVVVVMPCPNCRELVVLFRNKAIALSRKIMEQGSFEERKDHIAEIITEFFEPGMLGLPPSESGAGFELDDDDVGSATEAFDGLFASSSDSTTAKGPISEKEVEEFVRLDLHRIDEPNYFKKYFG